MHFSENPSLGEALEKIELMAKTGDPSEASRHLEPLVKRHPSDPRVLTLAAHVNVLSGDLTTAREFAEKASSTDSSDVKAKFILGFCLQNTDSYTQAVEVYTEITRSVPESAVAHLFLAESLVKAGRAEEAIDAFIKARDLDRDGEVGKIAEEQVFRIKEERS